MFFSGSLTQILRELWRIMSRSMSYRRRVVLVLPLVFFGLCLFILQPLRHKPYPGITKLATTKNLDPHPIDQLISNATRHFEQLLSRRSFTLEDAAARYRERRGRHPPPGFDAWFRQATKDNAIIVEEFFDRIHHDINPFWALEPRKLRIQAKTQPQVISVRNKKVTMVTDDPTRQPWIQHWTKLVKKMVPHLPDLDMAVNVMDESRVLTPWDTINHYLNMEKEQRSIVDPKDTIAEYSSLHELDSEKHDVYDPGWIGGDAGEYWNHFRETCSPDKPSRHISRLESFDVPVEFPSQQMPYTYHGFIQNFTQAQDPCLQPHLRGLHGTFIESFSISTTKTLFPLFGGSKLPGNNELLIPGGMYLSSRKLYDGGRRSGGSWAKKKNGLIWRGTASGGRNKPSNWWHFHRHRWVQMMNGTDVAQLEQGMSSSHQTFNLLSTDNYSLPNAMHGRIGRWLTSFSDVAFVHMECFPTPAKPFDMTCPYTADSMAVAKPLPMGDQFGYKYLPDVDGNSYSARWRAFLKSTSMPLKATIYTEWHDDRMIPWVHFVPFDMSYKDIYAVMQYFLDGHDEEAEVIAKESRNWANAVYRNEDMKLSS
ncbi:Lipopolysaccharide-modifying protein [Cordyceps fumosorosea ARSEF 2679]|uniref:Lipopolysaccharide-modifying protein n=1 Tax=Cordyceps fumosorosea (strain ARSEF 2679) TaxID=1081104 RepID=A0A162ID50_CORFA|nr:Lipopolysaccharide-modifying protein [Cordyceps fumosorosea ARSEF 2679]OAA55465.1 Lipopolysaccharide-modifying protein [Cordyceps fumosorosea ARSEF 2679]